MSYQVPATVGAQVAIPAVRVPVKLLEQVVLDDTPILQDIPAANIDLQDVSAANDASSPEELTLAVKRVQRLAQLAVVNAEHRTHLRERKERFERWRNEHPAQEAPSRLKPELSAKLTGAFPPSAAQVNVLGKSLRAHPITLVPEAQQETTHCRTPEQQLVCDYNALVLQHLKPAARALHFNICLSALLKDTDQSPISAEPLEFLRWARGFQGEAALTRPWSVDDLSAFECCDYELPERPKAYDLKRTLLALSQRAACVDLVLQPALNDLSLFVGNLQPRSAGTFLRKLNPLFTQDSNGFIAGLAALGQSVPEQYAVAALLELEPQADLTPDEACAWAQDQVVSLLKSSEGKLRGKLRKLAARNDAAFLAALAPEPDPDDPDKPPRGGASVPTVGDGDDAGDADVSADAAVWDEAEATDEGYDAETGEDDIPEDAEVEAAAEWCDTEAGETVEDEAVAAEVAEGDAVVAADAAAEESAVVAGAETEGAGAAVEEAVAEAETQPVELPPYEDGGVADAYKYKGLKLLDPDLPHLRMGQAYVCSELPVLEGKVTYSYEAEDQRLWHAVAGPIYGTQTLGAAEQWAIELWQPVLVNAQNPERWFGARRGSEPFTWVLPQAITVCDEQGVPQAQVESVATQGQSPRVEWLITEHLSAEELPSYFLTADATATVLSGFAGAWRDTNLGKGYPVCTDPKSADYLEAEPVADKASDGAVMEAAFAYDELFLEQLVVSSVVASTAHPYGMVADFGLTQYVNVLRYLKAEACAQHGASFAAYPARIAQLETKLGAAALHVHWFADRCLNFGLSCDLVNQGFSPQLVVRALGACGWVYNKAQYDLLMEARRALAQVLRDVAELTELCRHQPQRPLFLTADEPLGAHLIACRRAELEQGHAYFYPAALKSMPAGRFPPLMDAADNARFLANRAATTQPQRELWIMPQLMPQPMERITCDVITPLYATYQAPQFYALSLDRRDLTQVISELFWELHLAQDYGTQPNFGSVSLIRPFITNHLDAACWYGCRKFGNGTYVRVEAIRSFDPEGVPHVLVAGANSYHLGANVLLEQLLPQAERGADWAERQVTADVGARLRVAFATDWRDTNQGQGFAVTADYHSSAYLGWDECGSVSEEANAHFNLGLSVMQLSQEHERAQREPHEALTWLPLLKTPLAWDQLRLEDIYTADPRVTPEHPYSVLAAIAFPDVINALHLADIKRNELLLPDVTRERITVMVGEVEALLREACTLAQWYADRVLNFRASCHLTNGTHSVVIDHHQCRWVQNKAQYWFLMEARWAEVEILHRLDLMQQLVARQNLPWPSAHEERRAEVGLCYDYARHQQVMAGATAFDLRKLPPCPQGKLPPCLSPEDDARFVANRYRYEAQKLGATELSDVTVLRTLAEAATAQDQQIAQAQAKARGEDAAAAELYLSKPKAEPELSDLMQREFERKLQETGARVKHLIDQDLPEAKVKVMNLLDQNMPEASARIKDLIASGKDMSDEVSTKVKHVTGELSSKVSGLVGRFLNQRAKSEDHDQDRHQ